MKRSTTLATLFLLTVAAMGSAAQPSLPWTQEAVKKAITQGETIVYAISGSGSYWAEHGCDYRIEVQKVDGDTIAYVTSKPCPGEEGSSSLGEHEISFPENGLSPFFRYRNATITVLGTETVTVPNGTFDCTVVELKNSFGKVRKVWMIDASPGLYAKVVEGTVVYSLKAIEKAK